MTPYKLSYDTGIVGKKLLVLGGIHGNEPCGPIAINKVKHEIDAGLVHLLSGKLDLVPICNPRAFELNQRFYEENLNRVFNPNYASESYEAELAKTLRKYIDESEYMLDIHSLSGGNSVFLFKSNNSGIEQVDDFAKESGINQVISGWGDLYEDNGQWTTNDYANSVGVNGILIECGQHDNPNAKNIAYNAIINSMRHLGMISGDAEYAKNQEIFHLEKIHYKTEEGILSKNRKHGDEIKSGTLIARYDSGKEIHVHHDCYMMLPKHRAEVGGEWFYLAKKQ